MNYQFLTTSAYDDNWIRLYLTNVGFQNYELHYTTVGLQRCWIRELLDYRVVGLQSCHIRELSD